MNNFVFIFLVPFLLMSCSENHFREGKFFAGGQYVQKETLNRGKSVYEEACFACHGINGDGNGPAAKGLYPPVRNLQTGVYKFGRVYDGALPNDEDLVKILKEGLNGSPMLPWHISDGEAHAVVQYIKTFAPDVWEGKDKELGKRVELNPDPYGLAHKQAAIQRGKEVYYVKAACTACHQGYVDLQEYNQIASRVGEQALDALEEGFYQVKPQDSDYGAKIIPPDFTFHHVRSANNIEDLAVRIAAGVAQVMPTWKDIISDDEIWAVSYYVQELMEVRAQDKRVEFMRQLDQKRQDD
jgi:mono/diheme cytochrome c family protein